MKYSIEGFDQASVISLNKKYGTSLDCTDLTILRWFVDFYPRMQKMVDGDTGSNMAIVSYKSFADDIPLIGLSRNKFHDRMDKLSAANVLSHKTVRTGGVFSLYTFGPEYIGLIAKEAGLAEPDRPCTGNGTDLAQETVPLHRKRCNPCTGNGTLAPETVQQILFSIKEKDIHSISKEKVPAVSDNRFVKPTVEQLDAYIREKGYTFSAEAFYDFYESKGWMVGSNHMKDWKAACRTWSRSRFGNRKPEQPEPPKPEVPKITEEEAASVRALFGM